MRIVRFSSLLAALFGYGTNALSISSQPLRVRGTIGMPRSMTRHRAAVPVMIEDSVLPAIGLLSGFTALGAGAIYFVEQQGVKSADNMSEETKSRMAGMFMEDEVLVTDLDDTITKMEAALAAAEGRDVTQGDGLSEEEKDELRDEWDDDDAEFTAASG